MRSSRLGALLLGAIIVCAAGAPPRAAAQDRESRPRRNVIIVVMDGLRSEAVNPADAPTMTALRTRGVHFVNSHAVFPTFTTPNAAAIATGHFPGDTGDFGNFLFTGFPIFDGRPASFTGKSPGTLTPFIEDDQVLGDIDAHFPGASFLGEEALLALGRKHGFHTAAVGKISGAVGTFANVDPRVEAFVMERLGLAGGEGAATQVVNRDRHAEYFAALALAGATLEQQAVEVRHLQRTEVREAEEPFTAGQKGSSAMPHKRNPILSENLTGLARLLRGYALAALEDVALWHERDISHSSVERVIGPDATIALDFALQRFAGMIENLRVYPERMRENLDLTGGLYEAQRVLLALVGKGVGRQEGYVFVQRNAMKVWEEKVDFRTALKRDPDVRRVLSEPEIDACFALDYHLKHVGTIFRRVFGEG